MLLSFFGFCWLSILRLPCLQASALLSVRIPRLTALCVADSDPAFRGIWVWVVIILGGIVVASLIGLCIVYYCCKQSCKWLRKCLKSRNQSNGDYADMEEGSGTAALHPMSYVPPQQH